MNARWMIAIGTAMAVAVAVAVMRVEDAPEPTPAATEARKVTPKRVARPDNIPAPTRNTARVKPKRSKDDPAPGKVSPSTEAMFAELLKEYDDANDAQNPDNVFVRGFVQNLDAWRAAVRAPELAVVDSETRSRIQAVLRSTSRTAKQFANGEVGVEELRSADAQMRGTLRKAAAALPQEQAAAVESAFGSTARAPESAFKRGSWDDAAWPAEAGAGK